MKNILKLILPYLVFCIVLFLGLKSCESDSERNLRLHREYEQRLIDEELEREANKAKQLLIEQERLEKERQIEQERRLEREREKERERKINEERIAKQEYEKYKNNSLYTGAKPYKYCYGDNPYCSPSSGFEECSFIDIKGPSNSDVIVIIKKNNRVFSHAYIKAGGYYKFKLGNGNFQSFFYYGKGWNPKKYIKTANCGKIIGGFVSDESVSKSEVESLYNSSMTYTLYTVVDGNFKPKSSNKNEAF